MRESNKAAISLNKFRLLATFQGLLYLMTGLWPLFNMSSFLRVTGPKTDLWMAEAFGLLIALLGLVFLDSVIRGSFPIQVVLLSIGSAATLTFIDVIYGIRGVISPIYFYDALVEIALVVAWSLILIPYGRRSAKTS